MYKPGKWDHQYGVAIVTPPTCVCWTFMDIGHIKSVELILTMVDHIWRPHPVSDPRYLFVSRGGSFLLPAILVPITMKD